jgi:hypothetical protein
VLVSGCRSDQRSYEQMISPKLYQGAFTRSLVEQLKKAGSSTTWKDVMENVKTDVNKLFSNQTPQLEGTGADSFVFGEAVEFDGNYVLVSPTLENKVTVDAGLILGLTEGSVFNVFPPATKNFTGNPLATVEITSVDAFTAKGTVRSGKVMAANSRATEKIHKFSNDALTILFDGSWKKDEKDFILKETGGREVSESPILVVSRRQNDITISLGDDSRKILNKIPLTDTTLMKTLASRVQAWQKWYHVLRIKNPNPSLTFTVAMNVGQKDIQISRPDFECNDQDNVEIKFTNTSKVPIFINILDLDDKGDIQSYTLSQFKDPNRTSNEPLAPGASTTINVQFSVRPPVEKVNTPGYVNYTRDVMKIFATDTDVKFDFLEQDSRDTPQTDIQKAAGLTARDFGPTQGTTALGSWSAAERVILVKHP